jgi:signal transduction histidine kinase
MGTLLTGRPAGASRDGDTQAHDGGPGAHRARRRGEGDGPAHTASGSTRVRQSGLRRWIWIIRTNLPRGNTLDEKTFHQRHDFLCWVLVLHVPALFVLGVWLGFGPGHVALEVVFPAACVLLARLAINRRLAAFFVTAGLVYCSSVLVHLSGGMIEAHFHFFILIGLIALYQDWIPFLWDVMFTVLSHGIGSAIGATLIFNHSAGQNRPWTWAFIHGTAVLAACVAQIILWKQTEDEQQHNIALASEIAAADVERQEAMSQLLVNLARRNQSLLNRQLSVIAELEQRERHPDVLEELFRLDHLATRIRRNAESLLVLSGDDPARRWGNPVPLADVVRAAAAEVEDYRRVDVMVDDHLDVAGRAVADLAHLLAELIENSTTFSPPTADVRVRSHLAPGDPVSFVVSIEDVGVGMPEEEMRAANVILAQSPEVDLHRATMLGFHVVARLAYRYGIRVSLAGTPGGGLTSLVSLPPDLLSERPPGVAPTGPAWSGTDRYQRAAMAWTHAQVGDPRRRPGNGREEAAAIGAIEAAPRVETPRIETPRIEPATVAEPPVVPAAASPDPEAPGPPPGAEPIPAASRWVPSPIPAPPPKPAWWYATQPPGATDEDDGAAAPEGPAAGAAPAEPAPDAPRSPLPWEMPAATAGPKASLWVPQTPPPPPAAAPGDDGPPMRWDVPAPLAEAAGLAPPPAGPEDGPPGPAWWTVLVDPARLPPPVTSQGSLAPPAIFGPPPAQPVSPAPPAPGGDGTGAPALARRVPGTHLTPALRREAAPAAVGDDTTTGTGRDPARVRSMLSRFQASQRAGRAAAPHPPGSPQEGR